ncbi:hypothetical protein [Actinospica acidiphila]|uniref:hypothetical protein n=1 Tax=Actinospica acidiphila TaxID=304899 RepID=UPI00193ED313|nr:hypothetical protein [Actinospica acidiphila]
MARRPHRRGGRLADQAAGRGRDRRRHAATPVEDEAWAAATREGVVPPADGSTAADRREARDTGPGDRLTPTRHHPAPRVQPAKVGDEGTASALKKVAAATGHDDGAGRPGPTRSSARRNADD